MEELNTAKRNNNLLKILVSFLVLFTLYHGAEYMIVFENNPLNFFLLQLLFFAAAWLLGNWYSKNGLAAWGLPFARQAVKLIFPGVLCGVAIYGLSYLLSISFGIEKIVKIPDFITIVKASIPFCIGVLFSSFSEDILTRGIIYAHFNSKIKPFWVAFFASLVYLLNHIYRLTDGPESWIYIFLLGIIFVIPLINSGKLWFTGAMHWAGNVFFFVLHNVIQTETINGKLSPNYLFAICLAVCIPGVWFLTKRLSLVKNNYQVEQATVNV